MTTTIHTPRTRPYPARIAKTVLIAAAAGCLVAGSLTAQTANANLATHHTSRPTPEHLNAGWPYPYLPATLILTGLTLITAATRISPRRPSANPTPTHDLASVGPPSSATTSGPNRLAPPLCARSLPLTAERFAAPENTR